VEVSLGRWRGLLRLGRRRIASHQLGIDGRHDQDLACAPGPGRADHAAVDDPPVVGQGLVEPGRIVGSGLQRRSTLLDHLANGEVAVGRVTHEPAVLGQFPLQLHCDGEQRIGAVHRRLARWRGDEAMVVVLGRCAADDTPATVPAPDGRSLDHATAPTKTPPSKAKATSSPVSGSDGRQRKGADRGPVGSELGWSCCTPRSVACSR
jgi:hypothetical protein